MKLKQIPEDFIVRENIGVNIGGGRHAIYLMKKTSYTTERAIQAIADHLHVDRKQIGYAGIKDKVAITYQHISISDVSKERVKSLKLKDIELEFIGMCGRPMNLGDLASNSFEIVVRDLDSSVVVNLNKRVKNSYDKQRFSNNNVAIGLAMLRKDFKKAVELILESDGWYEEKVKTYLKDKINDYVGALRKVPRKILLLFIHSYQSKVFNETIALLDSEVNYDVPLVGFGTEFEDEKIESIVDEILGKDKIVQRDFIIQALPDLSCEGDMRKLYVNIKDLSVSLLEDDDLNKEKKKIKFTFNLPKGSYATNVIKILIS